MKAVVFHGVGDVRSGVIDPVTIVTVREAIQDAISVDAAFDQRQPGWLKVELLPEVAE